MIEREIAAAIEHECYVAAIGDGYQVSGIEAAARSIALAQNAAITSLTEQVETLTIDRSAAIDQGNFWRNYAKDLERRLSEVREAGDEAYRACNSAWAAGEPPHRVKDMLDAVQRLGIACGSLGAALPSFRNQPNESQP